MQDRLKTFPSHTTNNSFGLSSVYEPLGLATPFVPSAKTTASRFMPGEATMRPPNPVRM